MKKLCIIVIRFYADYLSFDRGLLRHVFGFRVCRFEPTCSKYMITAIERYGVGKGVYLGIKRLLKCHPMGGSGYDPI